MAAARQQWNLLFGDLEAVASDYQQQLKELGQRADDMESQLAASSSWCKLHPPKFDDILPAVAAVAQDGALIEVSVGRPQLQSQGKQRTLSVDAAPPGALVMTADQQYRSSVIRRSATTNWQTFHLRSPAFTDRPATKPGSVAIGSQPVLFTLAETIVTIPRWSATWCRRRACDGTDRTVSQRTFHHLTSGWTLRTDVAEGNNQHC